MKMHHDVDATTLPKKQLAAVALSLAILAGAAATAAAPVSSGKMLHDCCSQWNHQVR